MATGKSWLCRTPGKGAVACVLSGLLVLSLAAAPARAALGGTVSSVETDRTQMRATRMLSVTNPTHAVHSMTLGSGGTINEYANSDGVVFAVTWAGPGRPDLRQLLGDRFDTLQTSFAKDDGRRSRSAMALAPGDFVIHMEGLPGSFHGAAYLPGLVPVGFDMSLLR